MVSDSALVEGLAAAVTVRRFGAPRPAHLETEVTSTAD